MSRRSDSEQIIRDFIISGKVNDIVDDLLPADLFEQPKVKRVRVDEHVYKSVNFAETNWGKLIRDPQVRDPTSKKGNLFRRRFRVPFGIFEWIVEKCIEKNVFEFVRESDNERGGLALFAKTKIKKDQLIVQYTGDPCEEGEHEEMERQGRVGFICYYQWAGDKLLS